MVHINRTEDGIDVFGPIKWKLNYRTFIFSPTYTRYQLWAMQNPLPPFCDAIVVSSPDEIRGFRFDKDRDFVFRFASFNPAIVSEYATFYYSALLTGINIEKATVIPDY